MAAGGELLDDRGRGIQDPYLVAATGVALDGEPLVGGGSFVLWRLHGAARLVSRTSGVRLTSGDIDSDARMTAYACAGGALELDLVAPEDRRIELFRDGQLYRTLRLHAGERWLGRVPAGRARPCMFRLLSFRGGVHANRFEFVRRG